MASQDALIGHIVGRIQTDIEFLVSQDVLSSADGQAMLQRLPSNQTTSGTSTARPVPSHTPVPPTARSVPAPPPPRSNSQARALWSYTGEDADDLSFNEGEIIEITEETNADWWKGKNERGQTGLFPSNYVEKTANVTPSTNHRVPRAPAPMYSAPAGGRMVAPIPNGKGSYDPMAAPPPGPPEQQNEQAKPKKGNKYGKLMATSAAGGVGFGAGAAVGSGIINAIF